MANHANGSPHKWLKRLTLFSSLPRPPHPFTVARRLPQLAYPTPSPGASVASRNLHGERGVLFVLFKCPLSHHHPKSDNGYLVSLTRASFTPPLLSLFFPASEGVVPAKPTRNESTCSCQHSLYYETSASRLFHRTKRNRAIV